MVTYWPKIVNVFVHQTCKKLMCRFCATEKLWTNGGA